MSEIGIDIKAVLEENARLTRVVTTQAEEIATLKAGALKVDDEDLKQLAQLKKVAGAIKKPKAEKPAVVEVTPADEPTAADIFKVNQ
ncbi:MAG TPA: hypothetical protein VGN72_06535 [Tepidisphaeraceae bacterium]|nr:hypothetical protein [Tepidisphaeraceae bacterium]